MSQTAIIGVAVLAMVCCSSSSAAMLMMGGDDDTSPSPGPSTIGPAPPTEYKYEFIINVNAAHESLGSVITDIRIDGKRVKSSEIQINNEPDNAKCNSKDGGYECEGDNYGLNDPEPANPQYNDLTWSGWNRETEAVGRKMFTITTESKVGEFEIDYFRPKYVPGWIIKENGKEVLKETANGGSESTPNPKTVTYTIQ
jgi:hypothetical protein